MRLVDDWKKVHTYLSSQLIHVTIALNGAWASLSSMQSYISPKLLAVVSTTLLVLAFLGRYLDESGKSNVHTEGDPHA